MRGGKMRLSTVSRAPESSGTNDAEAPEARILPCTVSAIRPADRHAPLLRRLGERAGAAPVHARVNGRSFRLRCG
jgi:hypothetical protein